MSDRIKELWWEGSDFLVQYESGHVYRYVNARIEGYECSYDGNVATETTLRYRRALDFELGTNDTRAMHTAEEQLAINNQNRVKDEFITQVLNGLAERCCTAAREKGFWPNMRPAAALAKEFVGDEPKWALDLDTFQAHVIRLIDEVRKERQRNEGEMVALEHSELSEALEAIRHGNPRSEKIPEFSQVEEEYADLIIRVMDHCGGFGYRIGEAIIAKLKYNQTRAHLHGKKF